MPEVPPVTMMTFSRRDMKSEYGLEIARPGTSPAGALEHLRECDGLATLCLAQSIGLHEGDDLERFTRRDGRLAGAEELHDCGEERGVAVKLRDGSGPLFTDGASHVALREFAARHLTKHARPAVAPFPFRHDEGAGGRYAAHALPTRPHDREQRFDAVHAIPEKIEVMRLERRRAAGFSRKHPANLSGANRLRGRAETQGGGAEDRHTVFFRQRINFQRVLERSGDRFFDVARLARANRDAGLREMWPRVDALDQHAVHVRQQLLERQVNLYAELALKTF